VGADGSAGGILSRSTYNLILSCLHPDSRASVSDAKLAQAFDAFKTVGDAPRRPQPSGSPGS
jgi:hypothetical protein